MKKRKSTKKSRDEIIAEHDAKSVQLCHMFGCSEKATKLYVYPEGHIYAGDPVWLCDEHFKDQLPDG